MSFSLPLSQLTPQELENLHTEINGWYLENRRDLPWRTGSNTPWEVMVSEFMLQQTPVKRVLPVWETWLERWPSPADLAAEDSGEAVRAWGRLGYPRRALRLLGLPLPDNCPLSSLLDHLARTCPLPHQKIESCDLAQLSALAPPAIN